jgi:cytochrome c biogenesis factor
MGAAVLKISQSVSKGSPRRMLLQASAHLIHLGVAMLLFSYVVSSNMQTYPSDAEELSGFSGVVASVGDEVQVGEYTILLQDLEQRSTSRTSGGTTITSIQEATIDISKGGSLQDSGVLLTNLYGHNIYGVYEVLEVEVHVHKSVLEDLYINYQLIPGQNQTAFVQAKVIPMMNFLWTGFGLLVFGLALRLFFAPPMPSERGEEKKQVAPQRKEMALPSKAEKDYEALIEEEITRLKQKRRQ